MHRRGDQRNLDHMAARSHPEDQVNFQKNTIENVCSQKNAEREFLCIQRREELGSHMISMFNIH